MTRHRETCVLCGKGQLNDALEIRRVRSNVRKWTHHESTVWRCSACRSLHSLERIDLTPFYAEYPFQRRRLDAWTRKVFSRYLARLKQQGFENSSTLLDYGCGEGIFIAYLHEQGITGAVGYDPYSSKYNDAAVLSRQYDLVVAQDVIEHVENPVQLFETLVNCVRPGGILCIGTPRADGIDLTDPERYIHSLHQPYHVHIFSETALFSVTSRHRLRLQALRRRHVLDTPFPFVNWTFLQAYLRRLDNTLDAGFEEPRIDLIARSPRLLLTGLLGYFSPIRSELTGLFRKPDG